MCALLAACGGNVATTDGSGIAGSAGTTITMGTTTGGGMTTEPGMAEAGQMGSAGAAGFGGRPTMVDPSVDASPTRDRLEHRPRGRGRRWQHRVPSAEERLRLPLERLLVHPRLCSQRGPRLHQHRSTCPNQDAANFEDKGSITTEVFPIGGIGRHLRGHLPGERHLRSQVLPGRHARRGRRDSRRNSRAPFSIRSTEEARRSFELWRAAHADSRLHHEGGGALLHELRAVKLGDGVAPNVPHFLQQDHRCSRWRVRRVPHPGFGLPQRRQLR